MALYVEVSIVGAALATIAGVTLLLGVSFPFTGVADADDDGFCFKGVVVAELLAEVVGVFLAEQGQHGLCSPIGAVLVGVASATTLGLWLTGVDTLGSCGRAATLPSDTRPDSLLSVSL